jgi:hypothetical protein
VHPHRIARLHKEYLVDSNSVQRLILQWFKLNILESSTRPFDCLFAVNRSSRRWW